MLSPADFFDLSNPIAARLFDGCSFVWEGLYKLKDNVSDLVGDVQSIFGDLSPDAYVGDTPIYISKGAKIEPGAFIAGPAYIGPGVVIRHGAYVRENVIMLEGSLLGHSSEIKNSIMLPHAHAPHFNYVGDSILGSHTNLGAGTKLSNLAINSEKDPVTGKRPTIQIHAEGENYDTGLAKLGAIMGDGAQTGCNSVLNPGSIVGPRTLIYANLSLRKGYHPPDSIIKLRQQTRVIPRRS